MFCLEFETEEEFETVTKYLQNTGYGNYLWTGAYYSGGQYKWTYSGATTVNANLYSSPPPLSNHRALYIKGNAACPASVYAALVSTTVGYAYHAICEIFP